MVLVAAILLANLWWKQRRERAHLMSVEGFQQSLKAISPEAKPGPFKKHGKKPVSAKRRPVPQARRSNGRPVRLDPKRRAAARKRLEARRRAENAARSMAPIGPSRAVYFPKTDTDRAADVRAPRAAGSRNGF